MSAMFRRCKPGDDLAGCAGATRPVVRLSIDPDGGAARIGARRLRLTPAHLVMWHRSDAGTWHGVVDPAAWADRKPRWEPQRPDESVEQMVARRRSYDEELRRFYAERDKADRRLQSRIPMIEEVSSSGGADVAALVLRVTERLGVVTSGYRGRRDWRILVVEPDGEGEGVRVVFDGQLPEWRAANAPVEEL